MPRHNRRVVGSPEERTPPQILERHREEWNGREYEVRTVAGTNAAKVYRCPGCDQLIRGGNHLVVWPGDDDDAADRRHWHRACWQARNRRTPGPQRSRSAPRY